MATSCNEQLFVQYRHRSGDKLEVQSKVAFAALDKQSLASSLVG